MAKDRSKYTTLVQPEFFTNTPVHSSDDLSPEGKEWLYRIYKAVASATKAGVANGRYSKDIKFDISFHDYAKLWIDSGHLHERGKYKFYRINSNESFTIDNCAIGTVSDARQAFHKNHIVSSETREKMRNAKLGRSQSPEHLAKRIKKLTERKSYKKKEDIESGFAGL